MFEFTVARKYLIPKWRQLSVSIISIISILVIALVVWLIVVFFSVTHGLERGWIKKLTALTAPVRVMPTEDYYNSYYYQIDSISQQSNYNPLTLGEKMRRGIADPYDPENDEEIPSNWEEPLTNADGSVKDIVAEAFDSIKEIKGVKGLTSRDFEVTGSNFKIRLLRQEGALPTQATLTQAIYLGSLDPQNADLGNALLKMTAADLENLFHMLGIGNNHEDTSDAITYLPINAFREKLITFFDGVSITKLKTPSFGWKIPLSAYPTKGSLAALKVSHNGQVIRILVPNQKESIKLLQAQYKADRLDAQPVQITFNGQGALLDGKEPLSAPLFLEGGTILDASLVKDSLSKASRPGEVVFNVKAAPQGVAIETLTPISALHFEAASIHPSTTAPLWLHRDEKGQLALTQDKDFGDGVLLPKTFREAGIRLGDRGFLAYYTPTTSSVQEQRHPIYVAGFYDPGIIPIGGKFALANEELTSTIRASHEQDPIPQSNGINVRFEDLTLAPAVKLAIEENLKKRGLDRFFKVETYREYDFTKPLLEQLQSDKTLFSLISAIIILVACSNIISMLIILVNDKKIEIGIMRSMGASSTSIAAIFGLCGVIMGMAGSIIGGAFAILTLKNIDTVVMLLSKIQGHSAFNPMFYGESLPKELSYQALVFVVILTALISLLAGIIPAVKASLVRPSTILRG